MALKKFGKKQIEEILIEEGYLDPENLQKGLEVQKKEGGLIGSILVRKGWVSEEQITAALSKQMTLPFIRLSNYSVNRSALKLIPKEVAGRYLFFPFEEGDYGISIAMTDPLNEEALKAIEKRVPSRLQLFLSTPSEIKDAIEMYYAKTLQETQGR